MALELLLRKRLCSLLPIYRKQHMTPEGSDLRVREPKTHLLLNKNKQAPETWQVISTPPSLDSILHSTEEAENQMMKHFPNKRKPGLLNMDDATHTRPGRCLYLSSCNFPYIQRKWQVPGGSRNRSVWAMMHVPGWGTCVPFARSTAPSSWHSGSSYSPCSLGCQEPQTVAMALLW